MGAAVVAGDGTVKVEWCRLTVSKPVLKAPEHERLKLNYDDPLSNFAFHFDLRRYIKVTRAMQGEIDSVAFFNRALSKSEVGFRVEGLEFAG